MLLFYGQNEKFEVNLMKSQIFTSKLAKLRQARNGGGLHSRKESAPGAGSTSRLISNLGQI